MSDDPGEVLNVRFYTDYPVCNMHCPYCIAGHHAAAGRPPSDWNADRYAAIIDNLCKVRHRINVRIGVGGEFFTSKVLIAGAQKLSHAAPVAGLNLITNLSMSLEQYRHILAAFAREKLAFVASCHPSEIRDLDAWLDVASRMAEDYDLMVMFVAHPPLLQRLPELRARVQAAGLECFVQPFIGELDGKQYPAAYSEAERALIRTLMYCRHDEEYLLDMKKPGLCSAGHRAFFIDAWGRAYPCGGGHYPKPIGDFTQSPELALRPGPMTCPFRTCQCDTENINVLEFKERYIRPGLHQHRFRLRTDAVPFFGPGSGPYATPTPAQPSHGPGIRFDKR
jgi:hypothetical protein